MPEPENPLTVPFKAVISDAVKSVEASDRVKLNAIDASLEVSPDETVDEAIETVGAVPSYVQLKAVDAILLLLELSVNTDDATEMDVAPSATGVKVAL